jgi:hypothetical protein
VHVGRNNKNVQNVDQRTLNKSMLGRGSAIAVGQSGVGHEKEN